MERFGVLLVDDEVDFVDSLAKRLAVRGLHVHTAYDGRQALDILESTPVDVVVLDVRMPGMNGIETLKRIKAAHPGVEVIMLTGHADFEASLEGMELGFFDYLTKPIDVNRLAAKLVGAYEKTKAAPGPNMTRGFKDKMREHMVAADRLASLGTLAAEIAHEINNPLAVISESAGWLRTKLAKSASDLPPDLADSFKRALDKIDSSVNRAGRISRGLLNFARRADAAVNEIDLKYLSLEVIDLTRKTASNAGVEVGLEVEAEKTCVWMDPYQLRQVLLDLVTNALQAVPKGGWVKLKISDRDGDSVISVVDNGPGIPEENLERIFEPFFTTKPADTGTGLGLAVSRGIVENLGGRIEVESKVGQGATFRVIIPERPPEGAGEASCPVKLSA